MLQLSEPENSNHNIFLPLFILRNFQCPKNTIQTSHTVIKSFKLKVDLVIDLKYKVYMFLLTKLPKSRL